jgi:hypothetical protein
MRKKMTGGWDESPHSKVLLHRHFDTGGGATSENSVQKGGTPPPPVRKMPAGSGENLINERGARGNALELGVKLHSREPLAAKAKTTSSTKP